MTAVTIIVAVIGTFAAIVVGLLGSLGVAVWRRRKSQRVTDFGVRYFGNPRIAPTTIDAVVLETARVVDELGWITQRAQPISVGVVWDFIDAPYLVDEINGSTSGARVVGMQPPYAAQVTTQRPEVVVDYMVHELLHVFYALSGRGWGNAMHDDDQAKAVEDEIILRVKGVE